MVTWWSLYRRRPVKSKSKTIKMIVTTLSHRAGRQRTWVLSHLRMKWRYLPASDKWALMHWTNTHKPWKRTFKSWRMMTLIPLLRSISETVYSLDKERRKFYSSTSSSATTWLQSSVWSSKKLRRRRKNYPNNSTVHVITSIRASCPWFSRRIKNDKGR